MSPILPFSRLVHADWSKSDAKRWSATATRAGPATNWPVTAPRRIGPLDTFVDDLCASEQPTLAGFDFPIGVPRAYGERTGLSDFRSLLDGLGQGTWSRFYDACDKSEDIGVHRPFYPLNTGGKRKAHLVEGLGLRHAADLLRRCERKTSARNAACSLFWTLGANQVGKAAIEGWRGVLVPALRRQAALWPFAGSLDDLAGRGGLVIAETYPAEAYGHIGVTFGPGMSKLRQPDRKAATVDLLGRCERYGVLLTHDLTGAVQNGFGEAKDADDAFDAVMGLLGMIEVVDGRRGEQPPLRAPAEARWEGWILGRAADEDCAPLA